MVKIIRLTVCFVLLSIFAANAAAANRMVCYFGSWSVYRKNGGKFDVEDIDPTLCTHLIFGFVGLETSPPGIRVLDPWNELYDDYGKGAFIRFNNLRKRSPGLKTLVAIGGWNEGSIKYSETFNNAANRNTFTKNAVDFIKKYGFDGMDLDWEYPGQRGGLPSDVEDFTELLKTLRTEFDKHGYILTAAVAAAEFSFMQSYDVKALSTYLDFINVMTYDFHGDWERVTGHNAPLYGATVEIGTEFEGFSVDAGIKAWVKYGAPTDKLVLGVGMYGRTFTLASTTCTAPRCPMIGPGSAGMYTNQGGFLGYYEICKMESQAGTVLEFDEEAMAPYLVNGDQWVGYDNLRSIQIKVNYIINNNLGGAMIWSIDTDDFKGDCGKGPSPLLTMLSKGVASGIATAPDPTPVTPPPIDPSDPNAPGNNGGTPNNKKMVCYFGSWSVYRQNGGKFDVEDINPRLCTHLIFGFVGLQTSPPGIRVLDPWNELFDDYGKGAFSRFNSLRNRSPGLKTLVAIGGWNEGSIKYSQVFATAENRETFTKNAVAFIRKFGFNGLDLDWEYPGQRGGVPADIEAFTELLKTLRTEFDKYGYLLTAAVAAAEFSFTQSYDVVAVSTYLDFINVMTYDFHGAWEKVTGHNAPLYKAAEEIGTENEGLNVDESIKAWLRYGASPEKLILGVGMYGRSFTLSSTSCSTPRCGMSAAGTAGATTGEAGILGYSEICKMELDPASTITFDEEARVPYLVRGNQWVGYDNTQSIQEKVDYIHNNNLGGAMIWSVDTDDWTGVCGKGTYPLLTKLSNGVRTGGSTGTNPEEPEPEVPEPEPEVPEPEPEVPEPEPEPEVPEPEPEVPEPEPEVPEPEPEVPEPEPEPEVPEPEPEVPEPEPEVPEPEPEVPEPEPEVPEPEPEVPEPEPEPEIPEPEPEVPEPEPEVPEPEPEVPEPEPEVPEPEPEPEVPLPPSPCTSAGYVRDPTNCKVFYLCTLLSSGDYKYTKFTCGGVLVFDTTRNVCNFPDAVKC